MPPPATPNATPATIASNSNGTAQTVDEKRADAHPERRRHRRAGKSIADGLKFRPPAYRHDDADRRRGSAIAGRIQRRRGLRRAVASIGGTSCSSDGPNPIGSPGSSGGAERFRRRGPLSVTGSIGVEVWSACSRASTTSKAIRALERR